MTDSLFAKVSGLAVALAAIGSLTYLAAAGTVSGQAVVAVVAGLIGLGGGAATHQSGVRAGARAARLGDGTDA